jgi:hypothetical protein
VMLDCDWKFGSLKPSRNADPAGMAFPSELLPHTMGTNWSPTSVPLSVSAQS